MQLQYCLSLLLTVTLQDYRLHETSRFAHNTNNHKLLVKQWNTDCSHHAFTRNAPWRDEERRTVVTIYQPPCITAPRPPTTSECEAVCFVPGRPLSRLLGPDGLQTQSDIVLKYTVLLLWSFLITQLCYTQHIFI